MSDALLTVDDIHVSYGHVQAVTGVSLEVPEGDLVTLIGANGAGKSTTLKAIMGLERPHRGDVQIQGESVVGVPTHRLVARGLSLVPEGRHIFPGLSVRENLELGGMLVRQDAEFRRRMDEVLELFPRLEERLGQRGGTLSGGEQQMLAVGRALMQDPDVLLLDEPSLGLAPNLVRLIFERLNALREQGSTLLLVEQNAYQALKIADYAYVIQNGKVAMEGPGEEMAESEEVHEHYLGG